MTEAIVAVAIAALSGLGVVTNRLHNRINHVYAKLSDVELRVATNYVTKTDLSEMIERVESHMERIENKLDKIIYK
jgi:uncharacterized protein YicC (UPF0701 family)